MISANTFRGFVFERAKDVYDFGSAIPARSPAHIKTMRFIIWKGLGPTQGFDTKKPLLSPSLAIQGHTYVHFCKCSGRAQKKKAKGIAEQVRGQNLPGLVLVLFLPKPMEGVIVLRHFETF